MEKLYIVGNWKMNHNISSLTNFHNTINESKSISKNCHAWIAPQFIHISKLLELNKENNLLKIGAQNCSVENKGAFTGDISPESLNDIGTDFVILGHSERREIFKESDELLNQKTKNALNYFNKIIFCVGETLDQRESEKTNEIIQSQIVEGLKGLDSEDLKNKIIIAYEPVWAIGTGKTATPEQANEVHQYIQKVLNEHFQIPENSIPVLYGGSVKPSNAHDLLNQEFIDGALVGGASLIAEDFLKLCEIAHGINADRS